MEKTDYCEIAKQKMQYFNYSPRTTEIYVHYINRFLGYYRNIAPTKLTAENFQAYLNEYQFTSRSRQNQVINAIKFLYEKVLDRKYGKVCFTRPRSEKHLPQVIDNKYLIEKISAIQNRKHKAILSLAYSVALRVSEVINMKITDIDSKRMVITIRQAKGRKDRIVPLSENLLSILRDYVREYRPKEYLFNGQGKPQYSAESCNQLVKQYIGEQYHFHLLRHSTATELLERGVDMSIIQKLLGHNNIKTTQIYAQISTTKLQSIPLPI